MKKIILGVVALVVLATGAVFVIAQKMHGDGGPRHFGPGAGMFLRGLDLTDDQKAQVKQIMEASRTNVGPLVSQLRDDHAKAAALGTDGKFDQAQVEALAADQGSVMSKLIVEKQKVKAQIFAILTDAQKAKATEMRSKFEEKFKNGGPFRGKPEASQF